MRSNEFVELAKPLKRVFTILWLAFLVSIGVFVLVGFIMHNKTEGRAAEVNEILKVVFSLCAVSSASVSVFLFRYFRSSGWIKKELQKPAGAEQIASAEPNAMFPLKQLDQIKSLPEFELKLLRLLRVRFTFVLINYALNESVVIFGFVLSLLFFDAYLMLPFVGAGLFLTLLMFPNINGFLESASEFEGRV